MEESAGDTRLFGADRCPYIGHGEELRCTVGLDEREIVDAAHSRTMPGTNVCCRHNVRFIGTELVAPVLTLLLAVCGC